MANRSQYPKPLSKLKLEDYQSYTSNTLMIKKEINIEPCKFRLSVVGLTIVDFVDFCQEVQEIFYDEPELYIKTMEELN
jgi:hypothetical protein